MNRTCQKPIQAPKAANSFTSPPPQSFTIQKTKNNAAVEAQPIRLNNKPSNAPSQRLPVGSQLNLLPSEASQAPRTTLKPIPSPKRLRVSFFGRTALRRSRYAPNRVKAMR